MSTAQILVSLQLAIASDRANELRIELDPDPDAPIQRVCVRQPKGLQPPLVCDPPSTSGTKTTLQLAIRIENGKYPYCNISNVALSGSVLIVTCRERVDNREFLVTVFPSRHYYTSKTAIRGARGLLARLPVPTKARRHELSWPSGFAPRAGVEYVAFVNGKEIGPVDLGGGQNRSSVVLPYAPKADMADQNVLTIHDSTKTLTMVAEWTGPRAPGLIQLAVAGLRISWRPDPCTFPLTTVKNACPEIRRAAGGACEPAKAIDPATCAYVCGSLEPIATREQALDLPLQLDLELDEKKAPFLRETLRWSANATLVQTELVGVAKDSEHVAVQFEDGPREGTEPGKWPIGEGFPESETGDVLLTMTDQHGGVHDIPISPEQLQAKETWVKMPGVRCTDPLRYSYRGRREYVEAAASKPEDARQTKPDSARDTNRVIVRPPRRMARRLGVIVGAGAGILLPNPVGPGSHGLTLDVRRAGGAGTDALKLSTSVAGRFEGALSIWPVPKRRAKQRKRPSAYAFEVGVGAFLTKQGYFALDKGLRPSTAPTDALRSFVLFEATVIAWGGGRWGAFEFGAGVGRSFATRRDVQGTLGRGPAVGGVHVGGRFLNAPHGVLALRAHFLGEPGGVRWFSSDGRGAPVLHLRSSIAVFICMVARFDISQVPGLLQQRSIGSARAARHGGT